jgi:signal transduction histidine kinase
LIVRFDEKEILLRSIVARRLSPTKLHQKRLFMSGISRRKLLWSGLALSTSSLVARSEWAQGVSLLPGPPDAPAQAATPPREQLLFDIGWKFTLGHGVDPSRDLGFGNAQDDFAKTGEFDFSKANFNDSNWRSLNLPHDWAVELPFVRDETKGPSGDESTVLHGSKPLGRRFPETSVGWYRREFEIPASDQGRRISVEFDGAFRDTMVFVNGYFVGRSDSGYVPFRFDITEFLAIGAKNCIVARVDASYGDGWFYEGAGIYRHAWLIKNDPLHLGRWESTVRAEVKSDDGVLSLATVVVHEGNNAESASVGWQILDAAGNAVATAVAPAQQIAVDGAGRFEATAKIARPALWSVEAPNLYTAVVTVQSGDKTRDAERIRFGVRSVHAMRTSHNMPTPELVEACDRMGMMIMCETRQMSSNTRISTLVRAMKEFSHPDTKEKIPLDLNRAIESTIIVARNEWKYVADLETEFDSLLPLISCHPGEFNQVILNLIVNAAQAIADSVAKNGSGRGTIKVQTRNCPECVEIRIQDTGGGIPENVRARIFDPFFTTKEIGMGTGQGLAIARSVIVDKHGGSIEFETDSGTGTTFVIRLPHDALTTAPAASAA